MQSLLHITVEGKHSPELPLTWRVSSIAWRPYTFNPSKFDLKAFSEMLASVSVEAIVLSASDLIAFAKSWSLLVAPKPVLIALDVDKGSLSSEAFLKLGCDDFVSSTASIETLLERLTVQKKQQAHVQQLTQKLQEESAKTARTETILKQREEFLSVCAHDLRSPLGLIQSAIGMVLKSTESKKEFTPFDVDLLTRCRRQATQAIALVKDLLDVMAFEQGLQPKYHLFNLHGFLKEFYEDYRLQAEQKGITFHYENTIPEWRVLGDVDRIRQLLQNLFVNAVKFTESGKNIFLRATAFTGRRRLDPTYPMIIITLTDEGKGIPQSEQERIFDRFSQIKGHSAPEGRGLGLTVAKQISALHEGNIWLESKEGKGTTFHVLFPHVVSRTEKGTPPKRERPVVLMAEPTEIKRDIARHLFPNTDLIFAKDGVEALALCFHNLPDQIFLPTTLPKLSCVEVAELLRQDPVTSTIPLTLYFDPSEPPTETQKKVPWSRVTEFPFKVNPTSDVAAAA